MLCSHCLFKVGKKLLTTCNKIVPTILIQTCCNTQSFQYKAVTIVLYDDFVPVLLEQHCNKVPSRLVTPCLQVCCKFYVFTSTARNMQFVASIRQACYQAVITPISGCVCIACSSLMIASLLQQACCNLFIQTSYSTSLMHSCFNNLQ